VTPHRERGIIREVDGDQAVVAVEPSDEARCRTCGACGGSHESVVRLPNTLDLSEGDEISLEIEMASPLTSALLVFGLPFAGAVVGFVLAKGVLALFSVSAAPSAKWIVGLACVGGFVSSFAVSAWYDRRWRARHQSPVRIVEVRRKST